MTEEGLGSMGPEPARQAPIAVLPTPRTEAILILLSRQVRCQPAQRSAVANRWHGQEPQYPQLVHVSTNISNDAFTETSTSRPPTSTSRTTAAAGAGGRPWSSAFQKKEHPCPKPNDVHGLVRFRKESIHVQNLMTSMV